MGVVLLIWLTNTTALFQKYSQLVKAQSQRIKQACLKKT